MCMQTVEVIACMLRHPCPDPAKVLSLEARIRKIPKRPRIECSACGTRAANQHDESAESYNGTWVQCDGCSAWMHGRCIGFRGNPRHLLCGGCLRELACQVRTVRMLFCLASRHFCLLVPSV